MIRSEHKLFAHMSRDAVMFQGSVVGAGAAAPTIPTTVYSTTSSINYLAASDNFVSTVSGDITRSGAGVYTIKFKDSIPVVFDIIVDIWGTDGKFAQMTDYNPSTRVATVKTFSAVGAATDIATTDNLKLTILGTLTIPSY